MTDKNEFINGESVSPEARIIGALGLQNVAGDNRPIYMAMWTGDLRRFEKQPPRAISVGVKDTEARFSVSDTQDMWQYTPVIYRGGNVKDRARDVLEAMGLEGGKLDKIERQINAAALVTLKTLHRGAHLAFEIALIGTDSFNDGGKLHLVWLFPNGVFSGGDINAEKMKNELLEAGEELYTEALNASETEYTDEF